MFRSDSKPVVCPVPLILRGLMLFLVVSAVYLYGFPAANLVYPAAILAHFGLGLLATLLIALFAPRLWQNGDWFARLGWLLLLIGAVLAVVLWRLTNTRPHAPILWAHIATSVLGSALLASSIWRARIASGAATSQSSSAPNFLRNGFTAFAVVAVAFTAVGAGAWYARTVQWSKSNHISNPAISPETMDSEGDGAQGRFFPSSAQVKSGDGQIPSDYFMQSDACQRCHQDIYKQWEGSMHHFSSFNNQWYRKSIEYMQSVQGGQKSSKWCAGCHDPALLYSGKFDRPIGESVHSPEAKAGLGCMMCHSIVKVKSTMGQADFTLEYPELHKLAASKNPVIRWLHDFVTELNPEPHRRIFLKPFMKAQTAEFCSSCHKVHLDQPVNNYRWIRGFNEYDNWQASGVSGEGARSFYYPAKTQNCADCHMPDVKSKDFGNVNGIVHNHAFPGANTAVPTSYGDADQLKLTEDFLKNKNLTVDIFAISPERASGNGAAMGSELSTTFAVGEEGDSGITASGAAAQPITAPLNRVRPVLRRGDTERVDVVVRTKKIGHFFPGGTVDAYDTWLELKGTDDKGHIIFWSGKTDDERTPDDGLGAVEKGAHFYRSLQIDAHGNAINKRNAWATRSVVYVRLIPPGAADTVHYKLQVPESAGSRITLHARLLYRKFQWWGTQFSFQGAEVAADPTQAGEPVSPHYDDRQWKFNGKVQDVVAKEQAVPDVPIVALAEDEVTLQVVERKAKAPAPVTELHAEDWQRWNDYGIGLLLQGDLKNAAIAFQKVTEIDPNNADGWVNLGRVAVQEGDLERGKEVLDRALALNPKLARTHFFYAAALKAAGEYDDAGKHLGIVLAQYPRDRVALNTLGRVQFLQRKYKDAVETLQKVLAIDPEDLQANYNLMLAYNGMGDTVKGAEHQKRYLRFKADESAQAITGPYRDKHPEDNNERQQIHEHVSVPLNAATPAKQGIAGVKTARKTMSTPRAPAEPVKTSAVVGGGALQ